MAVVQASRLPWVTGTVAPQWAVQPAYPAQRADFFVLDAEGILMG